MIGKFDLPGLVARRSRRTKSVIKAAVAAASCVALMVSTGAVAGAPAYAADPCASPVNPIVCENSKPGTPSEEWDDIWGSGDETVQGFATDASVNVGQTIGFKIKAAAAYRIDIYRLGWYQGDGARKLDTLRPPLGSPQPECVTNAATEIYDCGTWSVSATWTVPASTVSGIFIAKLVIEDSGDTSQIPFVVRNDASTSKLYFKTSDATWQAYNTYGGSNFYWGGPMGRAVKLSYNRPYETRGVAGGRDYLFANEYPMLRFLERNGYDVSYFTDLDADIRGNLIRNHKVFLSVGHDEYWSGPERTNVEAARDAGVHLAFFSGNEVYWKTRWEPSVDGANTPNRTLVCYKETWAGDKIDPSTEWTGTWRDPRFTPPSNGGVPENALTGVLYMSNNTDLALKVPADQGKNRFWRHTDAADQDTGDTLTLANHTVGYESDEDLDNGFRPPGLIRLSTTTGPAPEYLLDFGLRTAPGTTTHHLTLYRAPSGALVFGAGTIQWAWGLDEKHDGEAQEPADKVMQQATVNLLADMGAQPTSLMSQLVATTASTDTVGPTTTITSPAAGSAMTNGAKVTVQGTATDLGGGRVAGVEVSTDGGQTWHPATGGSSWSYQFYATGAATQVVRARGIDDSGNIGTSPAVRTFDLNGPTTLFGQRIPQVPVADDGSAVTLGTKFTPSTDGTVTGVRFYKGSGNSGSHTGSVWSSTGQLLRTGSFADETATGWQRLKFSKPLTVTKGTTYIVGYYAPNGRYAADDRFFSSLDWKSGPLTAPRGRTSDGNGLFRAGNGVPVIASSTDANYYVDVTFVDGETAAPTVLTTAPEDAEIGVALGAQPMAVFSKPLATSSIAFTLRRPDGTTVPGATVYDADTRSVTFRPSASLDTAVDYTARVTAQDLQGVASTPLEWTFTTTPYAQVSTLFAPDATPGAASSGDSDAITLGARFKPTVDGLVIGVRFYKGPGNTGIHTGTLYGPSGQMAKATFGTESESGWQSVHFAQPVEVTAGATYTVAYWAPHGNYAYDPGYFNEARIAPDRTMTAATGANGVYAYGSDRLPESTYGATNYWVDPLFVPDGPPPPAEQPDPPAGSTTILGSATPAVENFDDNSGIEVGVKFRSDVAGKVHGIRFWKGTQNTGTHRGTLWTAGGQEIASGTFEYETGSGWQTLLFDNPVDISANTTFVASYRTSRGYYSADLNAYANGHDNAPLHVPPAGGVFTYDGGFPNSASNHNFWVDVYFIPNN
ncbi:DUF4082 domain-containing protein [Actinoplanes campanulatus]|uniref:DUF4082 domain-containing protein n=1 Tax=Actinoplanes campanulatus TaxID=113559 RepID=UPI0019544E70|nr:DUF4082 domain-containing protein [Actinoplanes capillaceus]